MARLYSPAVFVGFRRSNHVQRCQQALVKIEGVKERADVDFYLGKRVAYVYKVASKKGYKVIVGKIVSKHGNSGVVRAKFSSNLPANAIGSTLRVMLH